VPRDAPARHSCRENNIVPGNTCRCAGATLVPGNKPSNPRQTVTHVPAATPQSEIQPRKAPSQERNRERPGKAFIPRPQPPGQEPALQEPLEGPGASGASPYLGRARRQPCTPRMPRRCIRACRPVHRRHRIGLRTLSAQFRRLAVGIDHAYFRRLERRGAGAPASRHLGARRSLALPRRCSGPTPSGVKTRQPTASNGVHVKKHLTWRR
jgi:hypothetical protein